MICAISGKETSDAVVSPKSGGIFDRKLAETYVTTAGKDPLNDQPLNVEELVKISNGGLPVATQPAPAAFNSIPTMLAAFQNEWDAMSLEVFALRKQLHSTRQELSSALYKCEAAIRVAAQVTREKEEAQRALQQISETFAAGARAQEPTDIVMEPETAAKPQETAADEPVATNNDNGDFSRVISLAREKLFAVHKQSKVSLPVSAKTKVSLSKSDEKLSQKDPQTLLVDTASSQTLLTGEFGTFSLPEGKVHPKFDAVAFLHEDGSAKPIGVDVHGINVLFSEEKYPVSIENLRKVITHPSEPYFVALTNDQKWVFASTAGVIHTSETQESISAADIHVDGALLGLASPRKVDIVDLTSFNTVSSINLTGFTAVSQISFALNGYWLLVGGITENDTGAVHIYDLRKSSLVHTFEVSADSEFAIDASCQALVVCDKTQQKLSVHLYAKKGKKWMENAHVEECGAFHALQIASTSEEIQSSKVVNISGLLGDALVHYSIKLE